jgi:hypothetical protein
MTDLESAQLEAASAAGVPQSAVKLQKILVPTASFEPLVTINHAVCLAKLTGTRVVLSHVVEIPRSELNPAVFGRNQSSAGASWDPHGSHPGRAICRWCGSVNHLDGRVSGLPH